MAKRVGPVAELKQAAKLSPNPDGDRVLVPLGGGASTDQGGAGGPEERFVVVVNWFEELRQRLGN